MSNVFWGGIKRILRGKFLTIMSFYSFSRVMVAFITFRFRIKVMKEKISHYM